MFRSEFICSLFGCVLLLSTAETASGQVAVYPDEPAAVQPMKSSAEQNTASFTRPAGFTEYISSVLEEEKPAEKCGDRESTIIAAEVICETPVVEHGTCPSCRQAAANRVTVADMKESLADRLLITLKQVPRHFCRDNTFQGTRSWCRGRYMNGVALMPGQMVFSESQSGVCAACAEAAGFAETGKVPDVPAKHDPAQSTSLPLWHEHRRTQDAAKDEVPLPPQGDAAAESPGREPVAAEPAPGAPGSEYVEPPAWNARRGTSESPDAGG